MKVEVWNYNEKQIKVVVEANNMLEEYDELKEKELEDTIDLKEIMKLVEEADVTE